MGNLLKAMSMMLISVIGIGIVAYSISITPPDTSVDCEEQICTTGIIAQVVDGDTVKFLSDEGQEIRIRNRFQFLFSFLLTFFLNLKIQSIV